ncbi:DUF4198 domain-containing protein [Hyphococcus sp.]|uniref:DUF4198 domain-containing protein n=1 Tax=Hyphococcus sp. TaxID=2038636 RepID=UPI003CCBEEAF
MKSSRFVSFAAIAAAIMVYPAHAHDFWLEPADYRAGLDKPVHINFMVGHAGEGEHWNLRKERVAAFTRIGARGAEDISRTITPGGKDGGADVKFTAPGTYIIAFESTPAFIELDAETFNAYLEEEGLTQAIEHRRAHARTDKPGTEYYSRRAKTIINAGENAVASGADITAAVGHTLEIRPLDNPFSLAPGEPLPLEVLYNGAPLPGATVSLENLRVGIFPETRRTTDENGHAAFDLPKKGAWKFNVVWATPVEHDEADFETVFSSLTFSFE